MSDPSETRRGPEKPEHLRSVVYVSAATRPFSDVDLALLLTASRLNNEPRGLTGVLLYREGHFIQALEGPEQAVRRTLATIAADPRHTGVWILADALVTTREFGSWSMGYLPPDASDSSSGPAWFGTPEATGTRDDSRAGELLEWFRSRHR